MPELSIEAHNTISPLPNARARLKKTLPLPPKIHTPSMLNTVPEQTNKKVKYKQGNYGFKSTEFKDMHYARRTFGSFHFFKIKF